MPRATVAVQKIGSDLVLDPIVFTTIVPADDLEITGVTENTILLVKNSSGAAAESVTIVSSADQWGRTKDVTESIANGAIAAFGHFHLPNWLQTGTNKIHVDTADAAISVAALDFDFRL